MKRMVTNPRRFAVACMVMVAVADLLDWTGIFKGNVSELANVLFVLFVGWTLIDLTDDIRAIRQRLEK